MSPDFSVVHLQALDGWCRQKIIIKKKVQMKFLDGSGEGKNWLRRRPGSCKGQPSLTPLKKAAAWRVITSALIVRAAQQVVVKHVSRTLCITTDGWTNHMWAQERQQTKSKKANYWRYVRITWVQTRGQKAVPVLDFFFFCPWYLVTVYLWLSIASSLTWQCMSVQRCWWEDCHSC